MPCHMPCTHEWKSFNTEDDSNQYCTRCMALRRMDKDKAIISLPRNRKYNAIIELDFHEEPLKLISEEWEEWYNKT